MQKSGVTTRATGASAKRATRRGRASKGWIVGVLFGLLAACGEESGAKHGTLTLPVDPSLVPAQSSIGPRSVARMIGESGIAMDFVLGELIVGTDDQGKLDAFVARWGGSVVRSTDRVGDVPRLHQVKLDPSAADVRTLLDELNANAPDLAGSFRSSSDDAAKLLAVALSEANAKGMTVTPNFVVPPMGIAEGTTNEAPTGDDTLYTPNAFDWPYMKRGNAQDIGVGSAWQIMHRAGVFRNKVRMLIMDGGFVQNADMPAARQIFGDWNAPNLMKCGSGDCPWHGTMVASAAMGTIDDGQGGAGPAAPVAELLAVPFESEFFALVFTLERIIHATIFGDPRIINMSFSMELDVGWDIAVKAACLGTCPSISEALGGITATVAATNKLLFASAGNQGKDVDNGGASIEGSTVIPCELPGVICVGGMAHDSTRAAGGSNFGTKADDASVDIYGPYSTWVGTDPDNPNNFARLVNGTSFASPFVAGVAALVWASRPSLSAGDVWGIMRDTAHVGGVHALGGNQRRIDAHAAIVRVLGGAPPSLTLNPSGPTAPINRDWSVTAAVNDDGSACPPSTCPLTFDPAPSRIVGNTAFYRFTSLGARSINVTTSDPAGQPRSASITVTAVNAPPEITIVAPADGATVPQGVPMQILGTSFDASEGPGPNPLSWFCVWSSSNASDVLGGGCELNHVFTTQGARTLTLTSTDTLGAASSASVTITVTPPPTNFPPVIGTTSRTPAVKNYDAGFTWTTPFTLTSSATDPEGNTPITYVWKATSFRPNSTTVAYASNVTLGSSASMTWTPSSTPSLFGTFAQLGNDCYSGQTVRVRVEATDSLGNKTTSTLPDFKVYRCILN